MAANGRPRRFGPERGRLLLRTSRDGLAAQAGHDLTIEVTRWTAELTGPAEPAEPTGLAVTIELGSLAVLAGTGGVKPLSDRDRREIVATAGKVLQVDRYPQATFVGTGFEPVADGRGGTVSGTLTIRDRARPLRLEVADEGDARYRATATVVQSEYGIKPYTAFLGALRVRDAVGVEVELDLSDAETPAPTRP